MAIITVLGGCGAVGSIAVKTLLKFDDYSEIRIADINFNRAAEIVDELNSSRLTAVKFDAGNSHSIKDVCLNSDVILNCVGPFFKYGKNILKEVIKLKKQYIDINDDLDSTREVLELDSDAKSANICALIGMGSSPGVTNLLAKFASEQMLDETDSIDLYHAHGGEPFEGPGVVAHRIHGMQMDVPLFLNGKYETASFTGEHEEEVDFYKLGTFNVNPYPHPETITLPSYIKGVKRVTNKGTVLPPEYFKLTLELVKLGLVDNEPINVKGVEISPFDFTIAYIINQRDKILKEIDFGTQKGCVKIVVAGSKDGLPHKIVFSLASESQALGEGTGIPAALGAILMGRKMIEKTGVLPPEACVNPLDFLNVMQEYFSFEKISTDEFPLTIESIDHSGSIERITL